MLQIPFLILNLAQSASQFKELARTMKDVPAPMQAMFDFFQTSPLILAIVLGVSTIVLFPLSMMMSSGLVHLGVRMVGGFICNTCYLDFEQPKSRSFHLHGGGDREPCHHGKPEASPLIQWACTVMQDESAFVLPEIPRLPVVISFFESLVLLLVSYRTLFPIAAHGRGPPAGSF